AADVSAGVVGRGRVRVDRSSAERRDVARGDLPHRRHDPPISRAPAKVPRQTYPDLLLGGIGVVSKERGRGDEHAGRAETALHAALLEERALERADLVLAGETFDGGHRSTLGLQGEVRARVHRLAVEQHHAGAALRVVASFLGAGETELLTDGLQQADVGIELDRVGGSVDGQGRGNLHRGSSVRPVQGGARGDGDGLATRAGERGGDGARGDDLCHRAAIVRGAADVADRVAAAAAAAAPAAIAAAPPSEPSSADSASGTRRIVGVSAVIATHVSATRPPSTVTTAAAPTIAISI